MLNPTYVQLYNIYNGRTGLVYYLYKLWYPETLITLDIPSVASVKGFTDLVNYDSEFA